MSLGHDHSTILCDSRFLLCGLVYAITCIVCILVLVQRIRSRQRRRRLLLEGQMDSPFEKVSGEGSSGATGAGLPPPTHGLDDVRASLPSACDILQPLSQSSSLPPSGYLAAVLDQERRNRLEQAYEEEKRNVRPSSSPLPSPDDSSSLASPTDRSHGNPPSGIESSPTQADNFSQATSPPIERGAEREDQAHPSSPELRETQSVQKRSQQVHVLHDVDDEGVRTWRRWVIEYS